MPDGGRLTIATGNTQLDDACAAVDPGISPGGYARVSVTDTGMSPEVAARVFDPLFTSKPLDQALAYSH